MPASTKVGRRPNRRRDKVRIEPGAIPTTPYRTEKTKWDLHRGDIKINGNIALSTTVRGVVGLLTCGLIVFMRPFRIQNMVQFQLLSWETSKTSVNSKNRDLSS